MRKVRKQHPNIFASFPLVRGIAIHCYGLYANHLAERLAYHWQATFPELTFKQMRAVSTAHRNHINLIVNDDPRPRSGDVMACCQNGSDIVFRFTREGKEIVEMVELPELRQVIGGGGFEVGRTHI